MQRRFSVIRRAAIKGVISWAIESNVPETQLPRDRHKLWMLEELDLSNLNLDSVPSSLGYLTNLNHLTTKTILLSYKCCQVI